MTLSDVESFLNKVSQIDSVRFMPVNNEIGKNQHNYAGESHKDPADRMIVATARKLAVPIGGG